MKTQKNDKKFPTNQVLCVTYILKDKTFYITRHKENKKFTSWKDTENGVEKIKTSTSPITLERDFK